MKTVRNEIKSTFALIATMSLLGWTGLVLGQTFSSGSTGANGDLSPAANTVVTLPSDGVLNYNTVTIPAGITVTFLRNSANTPVILLATGDVMINGSINVNGGAGAGGAGGATIVSAGGLGGPGGFRGGNGQLTGGVSSNAGHGPGGGSPGGNPGNYGAPGGFVSLIPLAGGSGGGGHNAGSPGSGPAGGGGGGAIVVASSSKIVVTGTIVANGGTGGSTNIQSSQACGGSGSGGAIRLVAPLVTGAGSVQAAGGNIGCGGIGGPGKIRVEAFSATFTGSFNPALGTNATISTAPGPVSPASNPALIALPTLRIASIGAVAAPADPAASYSQGDISLPQGTANPVPVVVAATNMPTTATVLVRLFPQLGTASTSGSLTANGTFQSSTATAGITFPLGTVSIVQAWATMTLTGQIASLFPLIDGEPVESVAMASPLGDGKPTLNLVTKSGREKRFDELTSADQVKVAVAWQALSASR